MVLPWFFAALAAAMLFVALFQLWESFRAAFGAPEAAELEANAEAESRRVLLERKAAILENLRDLRFDHDAKRIGDEDFAHLEGKLRSEAKEILRLLDADVAPYRAAAEALITARIGQAPRTPYRSSEAEAARAPAEVETPVAETVAETVAVPERKECPSCGTDNESDAVFCKSCGHRFEAAAASADDDASEEAR